MKGSNKNIGFSLVELLVVIVILGILSTVVYIKWSESTTFLDQQTSLFASDIRYTQNLAITKNERCKLEILSNNSYRITDSNNTPQEIPPSKGDPTTKVVTLEHNITFKEITGVTNDIILFDGKGTPFATDPITKLNTDVVITLQNKQGKTRNISIKKITGRVSTV